MKKYIILIAIIFVVSFVYAQEGEKIMESEPVDSVVFAASFVILETDSVVSAEEVAEPDTVKLSKWKMYWKFTGIVGLKITQTQLVNWAAGGNSNFAGIAYANLKLGFKKKRLAWDTQLDTDFGMLYASDYSNYKWRKCNDKINFSTTLGYEIGPDKNKSMWFIAANGSFKSQYMVGYTYEDTLRNKISNWVSPSYTELSVGVNWKWEDLVSLYYSPLAGLITSCTDSVLRSSYGVKENKTASASLGMTFRAGIVYAGVKNLKIMTNLQLYTPYNDPDQKFGNINIDWDVIITYQFLKVLNVSLTTNLKYYHKVLFPEAPLRRVQFQEIFGLGVAYSF
jgi:hypothetical protein